MVYTNVCDLHIPCIDLKYVIGGFLGLAVSSYLVIGTMLNFGGMFHV